MVLGVRAAHRLRGGCHQVRVATRRVRAWIAALALGMLLGACRDGTESVAGRWQRVDQPREWVRFDEDRTFTGRGFADTVIVRGRYEQRGDTVIATSVKGHTRMLVLRDTLLVMQDGTRFRRADGAE
jgi:hypothetical protein